MTARRSGPPGGQGLLRRVFNCLFGPTVPPPGSRQHLGDRLWLTSVILASDLADDRGLGFAALSDDERHAVATRLVWHRWLYETGRLDERRDDVDDALVASLVAGSGAH